MNDEAIVALYFARDERAVSETEALYGRYLYSAAFNITGDREASRECVNEAYLRLWNSIPPNRPDSLLTYACKIVRRLAVDAWRAKRRRKRGGAEYELSLDELAEVCGGETPEDAFDGKRLAEAIDSYLASLSPDAQTVFAQRYFFADPVKRIAACRGMSVSKVKSLLFRTRQGLKEHLKKEGFEL